MQPIMDLAARLGVPAEFLHSYGPYMAKVRLERRERTLKKKGRKMSEAQRVLCQWTVMITNLLDAERFSAEELWVLYRVRWQIENSQAQCPSRRWLSPAA